MPQWIFAKSTIHDDLSGKRTESVRKIIQRVAALLALGPSLDLLYQEAAANAFTAQELQIAR